MFGMFRKCHQEIKLLNFLLWRHKGVFKKSTLGWYLDFNQVPKLEKAQPLIVFLKNAFYQIIVVDVI